MTDRLTPSVTDQLLIMYSILSLLQQLCTADSAIFYMADVNVFLLLT